MSDDYPRLPRKNRGEDDPKMIGLWKVGRTIGKGSSGRVRIARHAKTGQYAAVKIVSKHHLLNSTTRPADTAEHMLLSIEREIVIMKLISHPNVMRLYDVWETSSELYLILEYVEGGELFDYLCTKGRLAVDEARGYFQQIVKAVDYCHRFGIAHRDLKPENLLMDKERNIKVADFGMAAWQAGARGGLLQTACGSPHYAAPEVVAGRAYDGRVADIWSCGVILYALLAGRLPFDDEDLGTLLDKVKNGNYEMPSGIEQDAQDLIKRMLERDVEQRITMPEIVSHPFVVAGSTMPASRDMPDLDTLAKPVGNVEVDQDIFANLQTLWHGTPEQEIRDALASEAPNWHKGVYHLLVRYRNERLEDYDEEEEAMARIASRRNSKKTSSQTGQSEERRGMVRTTSQTTDLGRSPSMLPPRAAPPTPRRAGRRDVDEENSQLSAPQITLHEPTPPRPILGTSMVTHSPTPSRYSSTSPLSPNLPTLTVPDVQDDRMQQFFQQIVEHLNAMEIRAGIAPASPLVRTGQMSTLGSPDISWQRPQAYGNPRPQGLSGRREPLSPAPIGAFSHDDVVRHHEMHFHRGQFGELDKENAGYMSSSVQGIGVVKKSSLRTNDPGLRRPALRVQIVEPSPRKLKRKKSVNVETPVTTPTLSVSPAWSDSSFTLPSTPRRRWLGSVFKFKPATYQLLSMHDVFTSLEECRRLLVGIGVKVVSTHGEGNGVLKCRFDDTKDPLSVPSVIKAVRFRVEVRDASVHQARMGFMTVMQLVQERGASSSFQLIYQRLRNVWELDLVRPSVGVHSPTLFSPAMTDGGCFAGTSMGYDVSVG